MLQYSPLITHVSTDREILVAKNYSSRIWLALLIWRTYYLHL